MRGIYNFRAVISDIERYIAENGRFLYVDLPRKPHKELCSILGVSRRTYFLWIKKGIITLDGLYEYRKGEPCRVYDLKRIMEKIKAYQGD